MAEEVDVGPRVTPTPPASGSRRALWILLGLLAVIGLAVLVSFGIGVVLLRS